MEKLNLVNGERVVIHSLGDGKEYEGVVVGRSHVHVLDSYVIQTVGRPFSPQYEYDCVVLMESCLRRVAVLGELVAEAQELGLGY